MQLRHSNRFIGSVLGLPLVSVSGLAWLAGHPTAQSGTRQNYPELGN
jgi:hypothetical protein